MTGQSAIQVNNISKTYGTFRAVDNLSFEVFKGEIFAMLGPNGAGKSTTIRMILDILRPDAGTISILGGPINDQTKDRIGYLPEERGLYRDVKVIDVMVYLGSLKGLSKAEARREAMRLLEQLELDDKAESKVKEFSKGMQQKVQFAVTIMHKPEIIIIDEPFSGLDPVNTQLIKNMVLDLKDNGTAIIMSTHQMYQVEEMADRLIMINRGQQALYGPVGKVRSEHASHAVIVEGEGEFATLPGVTHIEKDSNSRDGQVLHLAAGTTENDLLAAIAREPSITVRRFELAVPSLNDIFIEVAGERPEEAEAARKLESGAPEKVAVNE